MIWILHNNVLSDLRGPDRAPQVARWLASRPDESLFLSVITLGEVERGIALQERTDSGFATDLRR